MAEKLPSGVPVYRERGKKTGEWVKPLHYGRRIGEIEAFLTGFLGEQSGVLHEVISDTIHVDVLVFPPSGSRTNWTFVTSGMSDIAMNVPDGVDPKAEDEFAELFIVLPANWFDPNAGGVLSDLDLQRDGKYWPIALIKFLARLPHDNGSWISAWHTFATGETPRAYDQSTKLSSCMVLPAAVCWPSDNSVLTTSNGDKINFFCVVPLYAEEMMVALNSGVDALWELMGRGEFDVTIRADRPSMVRRKRILGLF